MREPERKQHASELARARQLLRTRLGWLEGFPLPRHGGAPLRWQVASFAQEVLTIDRELLRRTMRALTTLSRGESAKYLPELVDDPEGFADRAGTVLELLARAVHEQGPLPADLAREGLPRSERALSFLRALSWCCGGEVATLRAAQRWVRAHAELVERALALDAGTGTLLSLLATFRAAQRGLDVRPLLALLASEHAHTLDLQDPGEHVKALQRLLGAVQEEGEPGRTLPALAAPLLLAPALRVWLHELADHSLTVARRELALLALLGLDENFRERAAHQERIARARQRMARWIAAEKSIPSTAVEPMRAELAALANAQLPLLRPDLVLQLVSRAAALPHGAFQRLTSLLAGLPASWDRVPLRAGALAYALRCHDDLGAAPAQRWLAVLDAYVALASGVDPWRWLAPLGHKLRDAFKPRLWVWFEEETAQLLGRAGKSEDLALAWSALSDESTSPPTSDALLVLFKLVVESGSADAGLALFRALPEAARELDDLDVRSLLVLAKGDAASFGALVKRMCDAERTATSLALLTELFGRAGQHGLLLRALEAMPRRVLAIAGQLERLPDALKKQLPSPAQAGMERAAPRWAERYPPELTSHLALLERCEPEAQAVAERILSDVFPDRGQLKAQLKALRKRSRLADAELRPRLLARCETLSRRLRERPRVSARKLENLSQKLLERAERTLFEQWLAALSAKLRAHSLRRLDLGEVGLPEGLEIDALLVALAQLPDDARTLARSLLLRRAGPPPWDLRERPENQAFLARLGELGIDVAPWLDPDVELEGRDPQGRRITLRFARDPFDVLRMGEHFSTCLSPGEVNFFSAVTNAVDINKRVLYAYDERGGVCGRCLFALTRAGAIVTFEPYNHNLGDAFVPLVAEVARRLAARMKTAPVPSGEVPTLVASRWYDDGAHDLAGSFEALKPGSPLRAALPTLALGRVVERFSEACEPLPLGPVTLPIVLALEELHARPELVFPLLPIIEQTPHLPAHARLRAATLLARAGRADLALRLCTRDDLANLARWPEYHVGGLTEHLARVAPSQVLRALVATRLRGVRSWRDEHEPRIWVATIALLCLRRTAQAERLFAELDRASVGEVRDHRRKRFAELKRELA